MMPNVYIFVVHLGGDKNNKFSEYDSINEWYLTYERHGLLRAAGCFHREDAVRYLTASGLQPVNKSIVASAMIIAI